MTAATYTIGDFAATTKALGLTVTGRERGARGRDRGARGEGENLSARIGLIVKFMCPMDCAWCVLRGFCPSPVVCVQVLYWD